MNQVRMYWIMVLISISFTIFVYHILSDTYIQGLLVFISVVMGGGIAIFFSILYELRKKKILQVWMEIFIALWVGLPLVYAGVIGYHEFPIIIFWFSMLILGIYILIWYDKRIKELSIDDVTRLVA